MKKVIIILITGLTVLLSCKKENKEQNKLIGNWVFIENPLAPIPRDASYEKMSEEEKRDYDNRMTTLVAAMVQIKNKKDGSAIWSMLGGDVEGKWQVNNNNYIFTGKYLDAETNKISYGKFEFRNIQWQGDTMFSAIMYSTPPDPNKIYESEEQLPPSKEDGKVVLIKQELFEKQMGVNLKEAKESLEQMFGL